MIIRTFGLALAALVPATAFADIIVEDAFMRVSRPGGPAGAAFMALTNTGDTAVTFTGGLSDIAAEVHLHTHIDTGDGVLRMRPIEGGLAIAPGATIHLKRGEDHLMFLGLSDTWDTGESVPVTLTFDGADDLPLVIPVDNGRLNDHGAHDHGAHDHGSHNPHGDH